MRQFHGDRRCRNLVEVSLLVVHDVVRPELVVVDAWEILQSGIRLFLCEAEDVFLEVTLLQFIHGAGVGDVVDEVDEAHGDEHDAARFAVDHLDPRQHEGLVIRVDLDGIRRQLILLRLGEFLLKFEPELFGSSEAREVMVIRFVAAHNGVRRQRDGEKGQRQRTSEGTIHGLLIAG